jgi:hypothetical protein
MRIERKAAIQPKGLYAALAGAGTTAFRLILRILSVRAQAIGGFRLPQDVNDRHPQP